MELLKYIQGYFAPLSSFWTFVSVVAVKNRQFVFVFSTSQ
jgi:hypothetical protein